MEAAAPGVVLSTSTTTSAVFAVTVAVLTIAAFAFLPVFTSLWSKSVVPSGSAAAVRPSATPASGLLPLLRPYFWPAHPPHRLWMAVTWTSLVCSHISVSAVPLLLGDLAAALTTPDSSSSSSSASSVGLLARMLAVAGASLGEVLFREAMYYAFVRVKTAARQELSVSTFQHILGLDMEYHSKHPPHTMLRLLDRGVSASATIVNRLLLSFFPAVFAVLAMCAVFWRKFHQPNLAMLVAGSLVPYAVLSHGLIRWKAAAHSTTTKSSDTSSTFANDVLTHVGVVQLATAEASVLNEYRSLVDKHAKQYSMSWFIAQVGSVVKRAVLSVVLAVGLFVTARQVQAGVLSAGEFVTIATYILQVYRPLSRMDREFEDGIRALVELRQLADVLRASPTNSDPPNPVSLPPPSSTTTGSGRRLVLEFDDVDFQHASTLRGVSGVSFGLRPGSVWAVCGPNGCGKSTLFRLTTRLIRPNSGVVRLCGVDIASLRAVDLRRAVVTSDQSVSLFGMSMRENLVLGVSPDVPASKVDAALDAVIQGLVLSDIVKQLPDGLESRLGSGGEGMSGGQQQRVVLARALLRVMCPSPSVKPRVLLLDESTSAMDPQAEARVLRFVIDTCRRCDCAVLLVTHRLSALPDTTSNILVLQDGAVVEAGAHEALVSRKGVYASMWDAQQTGSSSLK